MGQKIKEIKGKIIFKHQTAAEWDLSNDGAGAQYVPDVGERVLYDPDETHPYTREKFGDGEHIVKDLPFTGVQLENGMGENAVVQVAPDGHKNIAIGNQSVAFGLNTVAGMKGYYISAINPSTKKIYLSDISELTDWTERNLVPVCNSDVSDSAYKISDFTAPNWATGDYLGIINYMHYIYRIKVQSVDANVITYTGELGFTGINGDPTSDKKVVIGQTDLTKQAYAGNSYVSVIDYTGYVYVKLGIYVFDEVEGRVLQTATTYGYVDGINSGSPLFFNCKELFGQDADEVVVISVFDATLEDGYDTDEDSYTVFNLSKPTEGLFNITYSATAFGKETMAIGTGSITAGKNTKAYSYGASFGIKSIAGYASLAVGDNTSAKGERAVALGNYSIAQGNNSFSMGIHNIANENQFVIGQYSKELEGNAKGEKDKAVFIVGNGYDNANRTNALVVYGDSRIKLGTYTTIKDGEISTSGIPFKVNTGYGLQFGLGLTTEWLQTAVGGYNTPVTNVADDNTRFIVGGGNSATSTSNAMEVTQKGNIKLPSTGSVKIGDALISNNNVTLGNTNISRTGISSTSLTLGNTVIQDKSIIASSFAIGSSSQPTLFELKPGNAGIHLGISLKSTWGQTVVGAYNKEVAFVDGNATRFIIGGGNNSSNTSNAMEVTQLGNVKLPSTGSLKIGSAELTYTKLQKIINFIDSIEG